MQFSVLHAEKHKKKTLREPGDEARPDVRIVIPSMNTDPELSFRVLPRRLLLEEWRMERGARELE